MKLSTALAVVVAAHSSSHLGPIRLAAAQECVLGAFTMEFAGACDYDTILEAYTRQVFEATGNIDEGACGAMSAEDDLKAKLDSAGTDIKSICKAAHDNRNVT